MYCFYRPNIEKILQNNKENMATLGKNIAKGKYNDDKIEAAIPAIHPGFRLQVRITVLSIGGSTSQCVAWYWVQAH